MSGVCPRLEPSHPQHATLGLQLGFSQTNSHLGLGQFGLAHFQSHLGSSQTASHSGLGAYQILNSSQLFIIKYSYLTMSDAVRLFADSHTFRAIFSFTRLIRALNFTFRFLTFHITHCVSGFLAASVAS